MTKYISFIAGILFFGCGKLEVKIDPKLEVYTESTTYKAGEEVTFHFTGESDNLIFYSGELSREYAYRNGRIFEPAVHGASLIFTSAVQGGVQDNQLGVLISSDFDGDYSSLNSVKSATWEDITHLFNYGTTATFISSSAQDISEYLAPGKPVYLAFKYTTQPQATHGLARTWMIQDVTVYSADQYDGSAVVLANHAMSGFRIIDEDPENTPARSSVTRTRVTLQGNIYKDPNDPIYDPDNPIYDPNNPIYVEGSDQYNPNAVRPEFIPYDPDSPFNDPLRENWAVSGPIPADSIELGPDRSVPIKGLQSAFPETYSHTYSAPGTYKVTFVASNSSVKGQRETIRELTLTILPATD